jgi:hypothetical protein
MLTSRWALGLAVHAISCHAIAGPHPPSHIQHGETRCPRSGSALKPSPCRRLTPADPVQQRAGIPRPIRTERFSVLRQVTPPRDGRSSRGEMPPCVPSRSPSPSKPAPSAFKQNASLYGLSSTVHCPIVPLPIVHCPLSIVLLSNCPHSPIHIPQNPPQKRKSPCRFSPKFFRRRAPLPNLHWCLPRNPWMISPVVLTARGGSRFGLRRLDAAFIRRRTTHPRPRPSPTLFPPVSPL